MKAILNPVYGLYRKNDTAFCDSLQVAESFERQHKHILDAIGKLTEPTSGLSEEFRKSNFIKSTYKDSSGKRNTKYLLSKDGFIMLAMEFKTVKARQFKEAYIKRFNDMAEYITVLQEVKEDFPEFTEAVRCAHSEPKPYHYSNEIRMIYSVVLNQSVHSFKKLYGITDERIREYLTSEQLLLFRKLQRMDIGLLLAIKNIGTRKRLLQAQCRA